MPRIKAPNLDEHRELVWRDITEALGQLLDERDYDSITLVHIAEKAGIARNTLYRYATDKSALVMAVVTRVSAPVIERVTAISHQSGSATERVRSIVEELMRAFTDGTVRLMLRPSVLSSIPAAVMEHREGPFAAVAAALERVIVDGVARGEFRDTGDEQLTAWLLGGIFRAAADRIMDGRHRPEDLIAPVQDLVTGALLAARR